MVRKRKRAALVLGILLLILVLFLVLLPAILSSDPGLQFALKKLNREVDGSLKVDTWKLRWFGNQELWGVSYHDVNGHDVLSAPEVTVGKGLLALAMNPAEIGRVQITEPAVQIPLPEPPKEKPRFQPRRAKTTRRKRKPKKPAPPPKEPEPEVFLELPDLYADVVVKNGSIRTITEKGASKIVIKNLDFDTKMAGLREPVMFSVSFTSGDGKGRLSSAGSVRLPSTGLLDMAETDSRASLRIENLDLTDLLEIPAAYAELPKVGGILNADGTLASGPANGLEAQLTAVISELTVESPDVPTISEDKIRLLVDATADRTFRDMTVKRVHFESLPVNLRAYGSFAKTGAQNKLSAEGTLALDLARLSSYIKAFTDVEIDMEGKQEKPFHLVSNWEGDSWEEALEHADGIIALHADRVEVFGLNFKSLAIPIRVGSGVATVDLVAEVNDGMMAVSPYADFTDTRPALAFAPEAEVLTDVGLTTELADELLSRIHPLFKGVVEVEGRVDLVMTEFSWPLAAGAQKNAVFSGKLRFEDLNLGASGMLDDILHALRIERRAIRIGDREMEFACRNGRVKCEPLQLKVKGHRIVLDGSMGLDGTLDYYAEVPITRELVGEKFYEYLKGTGFRIPIRGTVQNPKPVLDALDDTIKDLTRKAATKAFEDKAGELFKKLGK